MRKITRAIVRKRMTNFIFWISAIFETGCKCSSFRKMLVEGSKSTIFFFLLVSPTWKIFALDKVLYVVFRTFYSFLRFYYL